MEKEERKRHERERREKGRRNEGSRREKEEDEEVRRGEKKEKSMRLGVNDFRRAVVTSHELGCLLLLLAWLYL